MKSILLLFIFFSCVSTYAGTENPYSKAEPAPVPAIENPNDLNLTFRGQGLAHMCYAFAEEQVLKDFICKDNCQLNASEWKLSVFDIAMSHHLKWRKMNPQTKEGHRIGESLANGGSYVFPYKEVAISELRASHCTLEKEIFYFNRSKISNPERIEMTSFIRRLYDNFKSKDLKPIFETANLNQAWATLKEIAKKSNNRDDFLSKVVNYSKCNDKIQMPKFSVRSETFTDASKNEFLIRQLLSQQKSVYVGICAEVLKNETVDSTPCGRHAIALKEIKGDDVLVVDSAFFSKREKNIDGSTWVPISIIVQAITKSSNDFKKIMEHYSNERIKNNPVITQSSLNYIKELLIKTPQKDFKKNLMQIIQPHISQIEIENKELALKLQIKMGALEINNINDIGLLEPVIEQIVSTALSTPDSSSNGNSIVWIE